jgi:hypothetical protein
MIKYGDDCPLCSGGAIQNKIHTIGETRFENLRCDMCAARFCLDCGGTLNVRGSSCQYKDQCTCETGEALVDRNFVLTDEDLESEEG